MERKKRKLILSGYSEYPGPRYCEQGDCSGEDFYHKVLNDAFASAFNDNEILSINLDGTAGYASSFLDEAFGNLVFDFSQNTVTSNIELVSKQEPDWKVMIIKEVFPDWENRRLSNKVPKKTIRHAEWYRIIDGKLVKKKWL